MEQPLPIEAGAATDAGQRRPVNEDSLALPPADLPPQLLADKGFLYLVADGIGGYQAGNAASDLATRMVMHRYYADPSPDVRQSLVQAIQAANAEIHRLARDPAHGRMGTTLVAALVRGRDLTVAHVGDSRAYLVRRSGIRLLTQDHTWVAEQVRNRVLTPEQAREHAQRHLLTRSLGHEPQVTVEVSQVPLHPGETVLLCSDGLWETVEAREMQRVIQAYPPQEAAQQLVDLANRRGGPDNITALVVRPLRASGPNGIEEPAFLTLLRPGRPFAWAAATLLLLAGILALIAFLFFRPLPSVPSAPIAPVTWQVREGDSRETITTYFLTETEMIPADLYPGQKLTIMPGRRGRLFYGLVTGLKENGDGWVLEVANRSEHRSVPCPLDLQGLKLISDAAPKKGDHVLVFELWEAGSWRVKLVDVDKEEWHTWYNGDDGSPVWLYTAFNDYLIPPPDEKWTGQSVLLRGTWQIETAARFKWKSKDLFVLKEDGRYRIQEGP